MSNIILNKGETKIEITSKPSVLQMDKVLILYRKFDAFLIGELELTLTATKELLVDKTKAIEIDEILNGNFWDGTAALIDEWGKAVFEVITKAQDAKKKSVK